MARTPTPRCRRSLFIQPAATSGAASNRSSLLSVLRAGGSGGGGGGGFSAALCGALFGRHAGSLVGAAAGRRAEHGAAGAACQWIARGQGARLSVVSRQVRQGQLHPVRR